MSSYLIIIEGDGSTNYSAYCPDLPGVVATGDSIDECSAEMRDAIAFHIEGLHEAEMPVPPPTRQGRTVEVAAWPAHGGAGRAQPSLLQLATAASTSLGLSCLHWRPYIDRTWSKEVVIPSSKTERIEVRVSEREQEVLREAAEAEHMTVSAFILSTVVPRAQEVVHRSRDIRMSAGAYEQFLAELDRPAESVPELRELFSRPPRIQFGEA